MVRQEIYGYLLTHYAMSALICAAAIEADIDPDIDPDRVKRDQRPGHPPQPAAHDQARQPQQPQPRSPINFR
jgi:hypothetical protein